MKILYYKSYYLYITLDLKAKRYVEYKPQEQIATNEVAYGLNIELEAALNMAQRLKCS